MSNRRFRGKNGFCWNSRNVTIQDNMGLLLNQLKAIKSGRSSGVERLVQYSLLLLRVASLQYWLVNRAWDRNDDNRKFRDTVVDVSVIGQCAIVILLMQFTPNEYLCVASAFSIYLLFLLYLSLLNIVFFSGWKSVDKPSTSVTRSLILLGINVLQVTFTFALFYRHWLDLPQAKALFGSFLVLGTIGTPQIDGIANPSTPLIPLQIIANLVLLAFGLAVFAGKVKMRFLDDDD